MKILFVILLFSTVTYSQAIRVDKADSDSLWQELKAFDRDIVKEGFTLRYDETDGILWYGQTAFPLINLPEQTQTKIKKRLLGHIDNRRRENDSN